MKIPKTTWYIGKRRRIWFGEEIRNGFLFMYTTDALQFHFLQPLSSSAFQQNVTFHCRNAVAYYDTSAKSYRKAAIFASTDDKEIGAGRRNHQYQVPTEERKNRMNVWGRTMFQFTTEKNGTLSDQGPCPH